MIPTIRKLAACGSALFTLLLFALICLPLVLQAATFQEGRHYQRLPNPIPTSTDDKVEVVEIFWYGCPHCFHLEPVVSKWLENKPNNVEFVRIPAVLGSSWELGARAFYVAESLGILDQIHTPLFDAIHVQKKPMRTVDDLAAFFAEHGVDRATFDKTFNSFDVETKLRRSQDLVRRYRVDGVPTVIVNGKYMTTGTMAGSSEGIFEVVDYLVAQESKQS